MLPDRDQNLENTFPQLAATGYRITSQRTTAYNCIAWAAKDDERFWWPKSDFGYFWPEQVEKVETIDAFILAYETVGFSVCESNVFEDGYEKIAIYTDANGIPKHGARMLDEKTWTSKLGSSYDISHSFNGLDGDAYGVPRVFMKRLLQGN